jgi:hypothetical protein
MGEERYVPQDLDFLLQTHRFLPLRRRGREAQPALKSSWK